MRAFWRKSYQRTSFCSWDNCTFFSVFHFFEKLLNFSGLWWPDHLTWPIDPLDPLDPLDSLIPMTHWVSLEKTRSISIIWHLQLDNWWVQAGLGKNRPHLVDFCRWKKCRAISSRLSIPCNWQGGILRLNWPCYGRLSENRYPNTSLT